MTSAASNNQGVRDTVYNYFVGKDKDKNTDQAMTEINEAVQQIQKQVNDDPTKLEVTVKDTDLFVPVERKAKWIVKAAAGTIPDGYDLKLDTKYAQLSKDPLSSAGVQKVAVLTLQKKS